MAEPSFDLAAAHRWFGVELNNGTWDALTSGSVTPETAVSSANGLPAATGTDWLQDSSGSLDGCP